MELQIPTRRPDKSKPSSVDDFEEALLRPALETIYYIPTAKCNNSYEFLERICGIYEYLYPAQLLLGYLKLANGQTSQAYQALQRCLSSEDVKKRALSSVLLSRGFLLMGDINKASSYLRDAETLNPSVTSCFTFFALKAEIFYLLEQTKQALDMLEPLLEWCAAKELAHSFELPSIFCQLQPYSSPSLQPILLECKRHDLATTLVALINLYITQNEVVKAKTTIEKCKGIFGSTPEQWRFVVLDALCLVLEGKGQDAMLKVKSISPVELSFADSQLALSNIFWKCKSNRPLAMECLRYLQCNSSKLTSEMYQATAVMLMKLHLPFHALEQYRKAIFEHPDDLNIARGLGKMLVTCYQYEEAKCYYEHAFTRSALLEKAMKPDYCLLLGRIQEWKELCTALTDVLDGTSLSQDEVEHLLLTSTLLCRDKLNLDRAERKSPAQEHQLDARALNGLVSIFETAVILRNNPCEVPDGLFEAYKSLVFAAVDCYDRQGASSEVAISLLNKVLAFEKQNTEANFRLAKLFYRKGLFTSVNRCLSIAFEAKDSVKEAMELRNKLIYCSLRLRSGNYVRVTSHPKVNMAAAFSSDSFKQLITNKQLYKKCYWMLMLLRYSGKLRQAGELLRHLDEDFATNSVEEGGSSEDFEMLYGFYSRWAFNPDVAIKNFISNQGGEYGIAKPLGQVIATLNEPYGYRGLSCLFDKPYKNTTLARRCGRIHLSIDLEAEGGSTTKPATISFKEPRAEENLELYVELQKIQVKLRMEHPSSMCKNLKEALKAVENDGHSKIIVLMSLSELLLLQNNLEEAEEVLQQIFQIASENYSLASHDTIEKAFLVLADLLFHRGEVKAAQLFVQVVKDCNASAAKAWELEAEIYLNNEQQKYAIDSFAMAWKLYQRQIPVIGRKLGLLLLKEQRYAEALACGYDLSRLTDLQFDVEKEILIPAKKGFRS